MAGLRTTMLGAHLVVLMAGLVVGQQSLFRSVPTTVKTSENDTVLLPCYVDNLGGHKVRWWWWGSKLLMFLTFGCVQVVTRWSQGAVVVGQQVADVPDVWLCAGGHKVRWWWGSKLLVDSSDPDVTLNSRVKIFPNNTLQVSDLRAEDTGEYKCQVIRPKPWGLMEQLHAIEVLYPPSVVPHPGTGLLEVQLGGDVDMGCEAKGVPKPIITWTNRHGDEMQLLDHRPRLRFRADDRQLSGTYTCVAINGVGEPANATIQLRIFYPPEVTVDKTWIHAAPGLRSELVCRVMADPQARVEWVFQDRPVVTSSRVIALSINEKNTLLIRSVRASELGHYTCKASNMMGHSQQVVELSDEKGNQEETQQHLSGKRIEKNKNKNHDVRNHPKRVHLTRSYTRTIRVIMVNHCIDPDSGVRDEHTNAHHHTPNSPGLSVANSAVFKSEYHRVPSNSNYTLVWEVDSYSAIIEYNLMFRRYNPTVNTPWTKLVIPADDYAAGPLHTRSYTLTGLSPATVYEGMVLSRNRFGWSRPSAILRFGTDGSGRTRGSEPAFAWRESGKPFGNPLPQFTRPRFEPRSLCPLQSGSTRLARSEDNELVPHMDTRDENLLPDLLLNRKILDALEIKSGTSESVAKNYDH
uniref:(California timema) hypothetical protein n=1 Tax=Timema californicum TaxID=61474 RepID=A0A7R9J062_TIMCA|nr:unnamed protein product [Timema californicum]